MHTLPKEILIKILLDVQDYVCDTLKKKLGDGVADIHMFFYMSPSTFGTQGYDNAINKLSLLLKNLTQKYEIVSLYELSKKHLIDLFFEINVDNRKRHFKSVLKDFNHEYMDCSECSEKNCRNFNSLIKYNHEKHENNRFHNMPYIRFCTHCRESYCDKHSVHLIRDHFKESFCNNCLKDDNVLNKYRIQLPLNLISRNQAYID